MIILIFKNAEVINLHTYTLTELVSSVDIMLPLKHK